ncbi:UNVERIFIED_CONTAM: hypothetical protein Cloal_1289 [Acetivibrio alkalicellulosi]
MRYILDITKNNFERIDFTEAKILDFHCQCKLPSNVEFKTWGATILSSPTWNHVEKFDSYLTNNDDMYIAGEGIVKIDKVIGGNVEVYAYDNIRGSNNRTIVAKNCDGSELVFRREWQFDKGYKLDEYLWECVMSWPDGFCNLKLYSDNGNVTYEFDTKNMISVEEYINNPLVYSYHECPSV